MKKYIKKYLLMWLTCHHSQIPSSKAGLSQYTPTHKTRTTQNGLTQLDIINVTI